MELQPPLVDSTSFNAASYPETLNPRAITEAYALGALLRGLAGKPPEDSSTRWADLQYCRFLSKNLLRRPVFEPSMTEPQRESGAGQKPPTTETPDNLFERTPKALKTRNPP